MNNLNALISEVQQLKCEELITKQLELLDSTPFLDIELSASCNVDCIMCPRDKLKRSNPIMSEKLIEHLINWIPKDAKVMLAGLGEPLFNKYYYHFVSTLNKRGIETGLTTNGLFLTPDVIDKLIQADIRLIQVSFNGVSESVYQNIMPGSCLSTVAKNLKYLAKTKANNLIVKLAVTLQDKNKNELPAIRKFADSLDFEVFVRNLHSRAETTFQKGFLDLPNGCGIFSKVTFVASDGHILSCCQDLGKQFILGHILQDSFVDILTKKKRIVKNNDWFLNCSQCDDDYRYYLLCEDSYTSEGNKIALS
jgi:radical SAM protein with 4Fe4S-binding SPASM domain